MRKVLSLAIAQIKRRSEELTGIHFVRSDEKPSGKKEMTTRSTIVGKNDDWSILVNMANRHYEFSPDVVITAKCPDITAISKELRGIG